MALPSSAEAKRSAPSAAPPISATKTHKETDKILVIALCRLPIWGDNDGRYNYFRRLHERKSIKSEEIRAVHARRRARIFRLRGHPSNCGPDCRLAIGCGHGEFFKTCGQLLELPLPRERRGVGPCRLPIRQTRQRRFAVHGGDGTIEPQVFGLFGIPASLEDRVQIAELTQ